MEKSEPEEPSFPTIAYKSSSTVYMRNYKPGSEGRVTLGVGSLGWRERVTLGGEPTFSHVNGCKRVNSPSGSKSRHAEHAHAHISVADSESESSPSFAVSRETDLQHQMAWLPETLRRDVQCSLCIKTISNPKSLPCNHSSCCECLRKLAAVRKQQGFATIECPECKMLWEIPESGSLKHVQLPDHKTDSLIYLLRQKTVKRSHLRSVAAVMWSKWSIECWQALQFR